MALAYHEKRLDLDRIVASLIPLYFGRVASLIIETQEMTTDQAEAFVERQAKAFELTKPYLVDRWEQKPRSAKAAKSAKSATKRRAAAERSRE